MLKRTLRVLTAAALVVTGSTVLAAQPASAATISNLNPYLGSVGGFVVDGVHQRLFTSNNSTGEIVVTDLIGTNVKRIDGLKDVAGLVLSADSSLLYAAVGGADEIVAIDTSMLEQVAEYPLGDGVAPQTLVRAGDTLWFGYLVDPTTTDTAAGIGTLDLAGSDHAVTVLTQLAGLDVEHLPLLAVSPTDPDLLATVDTGADPSVVRLYDFSSGTATLVASHTATGLVNNLVFTSDGTRLIEDGGNQAAEELSTTDLSRVQEYPAGLLPIGLAVADDGTIAVGQAGDSSDVKLYRPGSSEPIKTLSLNKSGSGYNHASVHFLTFEPGSERVIALAYKYFVFTK